MKALISTGMQCFPGSSKSNASSIKPRFACCLRLEGHGNADISQSSNIEETKDKEIWKLFKEAQQNILYLNKQRLKAVEELTRINEENRFLLDKIEQLEAEKQARFGKDKVSLSSEMLLRIDSMVLTGMITTREASEFRRLIVDCRVSVDDVLIDTEEKSDVEFLAALQHFSDRSKKNALHIVHICTEMAPMVSVGSLASYITGLSCALQRKGHLVEVILPKYMTLDLDEVQGLHEIEADSYSYFNGQLHVNRIWTGIVYGIGVTLIEPQYYGSFFDRERVYGYSDDFERAFLGPMATVDERMQRSYLNMMAMLQKMIDLLQNPPPIVSSATGDGEEERTGGTEPVDVNVTKGGGETAGEPRPSLPMGGELAWGERFQTDPKGFGIPGGEAFEPRPGVVVSGDETFGPNGARPTMGDPKITLSEKEVWTKGLAFSRGLGARCGLRKAGKAHRRHPLENQILGKPVAGSRGAAARGRGCPGSREGRRWLGEVNQLRFGTHKGRRARGNWRRLEAREARVRPGEARSRPVRGDPRGYFPEKGVRATGLKGSRHLGEHRGRRHRLGVRNGQRTSGRELRLRLLKNPTRGRPVSGRAVGVGRRRQGTHNGQESSSGTPRRRCWLVRRGLGRGESAGVRWEHEFEKERGSGKEEGMYGPDWGYGEFWAKKKKCWVGNFRQPIVIVKKKNNNNNKGVSWFTPCGQGVFGAGVMLDP